MKLLTHLSLLAWLALPVAGFAQAGAGNAGAAGRQQPGEDTLTRDTLSQSDLKRLAEQVDQWKRADGKKGVLPRVAKERSAAMLGVLKVSCVLTDAAYRGQVPDAAGPHIYEAACDDGTGYLLMLQGSTLTYASCQAASATKCSLPANVDGEPAPAPTPTPAAATPADSRPTLAWFKEALSRNGVSCESKRARIIGRESIKRRYLVEFECTDHPDGLVAYVPAAGDTSNAFESMNCVAAAAKAIRCELNGTQ